MGQAPCACSGWRVTCSNRLGATLLAAIALSACNPIYGAGFGYPDAVPVPRGAQILATDEGSDDDDPIRSRQQVVDLGTATEAEILAFYRDAYPSSAGWEDRAVDADTKLCLVNAGNADYTQVVEVYGYDGTRVPASPGRLLVSVSRIANPDPDVCGFTFAWISMDLFGSGSSASNEPALRPRP